MKSRAKSLMKPADDFSKLLTAVLEGVESIDALLEDTFFEGRLHRIAASMTRDPYDTEDLANEVVVKLYRALPEFKPDYERAYGSFFPWLFKITKNSWLDSKRKIGMDFSNERAEELSIKDARVDVEGEAISRETVAALARHIKTLPRKEKLAATFLILDGLSAREAAEKLTVAGFPSSQGSIRRLLSHSLGNDFPFLKFGFRQKPAKATRFRGHSQTMTNVTATRAKNEFGSILEQAIHSGPVAITRHDVPKAVLIRYADYEFLERARAGLLQDLESDFDELLRSMQTAKSQKAVDAAFAATPARLGLAAVKQAVKKR